LPSTYISERLGTRPEVAWNVGDEIRNVTSGSTRKRQNTYWLVSSYVENQRAFFEEFRRACKWLAQHQTLLDEIDQTGGSVTLDINLFGGANIGDTLKHEDLVMAAELGVHLGIEMFPKMNREKQHGTAPWNDRDQAEP
jgi:hypothetical protein